jgi:hypothetical protein
MMGIAYEVLIGTATAIQEGGALVWAGGLPSYSYVPH